MNPSQTTTHQFSVGDRVQFNELAVTLCDPAIPLADMKGTIIDIRPNGALDIQFDDGKPSPGVYSPRFFELEPSCDSPRD
jgi:hypothetical protein